MQCHPRRQSAPLLVHACILLRLPQNGASFRAHASGKERVSPVLQFSHLLQATPTSNLEKYATTVNKQKNPSCRRFQRQPNLEKAATPRTVAGPRVSWGFGSLVEDFRGVSGPRDLSWGFGSLFGPRGPETPRKSSKRFSFTDRLIHIYIYIYIEREREREIYWQSNR